MAWVIKGVMATVKNCNTRGWQMGRPLPCRLWTMIDSDARLQEEPMMHGRVHRAATSSDFSAEINQSAHSSDPTSSTPSFHFEKPIPSPWPPQGQQQQQQQQQQAPQPGTYVVQVPKDKVFRVPPPENASLFEHYTRRAKRRRLCPCFRVCFYLFVTVFSLAVLLAAFAAVMYLVLKPKQPEYTLKSLAVSGLDGISNASAPGSFLPEFDATVRAGNPNSKIGVHYESDGSHVAVAYGGLSLANGVWPAFYQERRNVTLFVAKAKGAGIRFSERVRGQMAAAERLRSVPFDVDIKVPVRLQLGGVKTWAVPVRVRCAVAVDSLAADAKVVSRSCDVKVPPLFRRN